MTVEAHTFTLSERRDKRFVGSPVRYQATCECGFIGEWRAQRREADADGLIHQATATAPPDLEAA